MFLMVQTYPASFTSRSSVDRRTSDLPGKRLAVPMAACLLIRNAPWVSELSRAHAVAGRGPLLSGMSNSSLLRDAGRASGATRGP